MDPFREIRPYQDEEIRPVLDSLLDNAEFIFSIASYNFPRLTRIFPQLVCVLAKKRLVAQLKNVRSVATMQDLIAVYMDRMIGKTCTSVTNSGLENLQADRSYLFMSNHRDIAMDPAFVNYMLYHAGFETLQIAIGDNLLKKPFVTDLMRLNKSFIVRRSLKGRELLKALDLLSQYIHFCIENKRNVWIAQREGRAKDGVDKTDAALIKMLARGKKHLPLGESIASLHVIPVAISYEYDACDLLKSEELYQVETAGSFTKTDGSDIQSIVTGITGMKGHVHVAFGNELQIESDDPDMIATQIDQQITANYLLQDSNFLALEFLRDNVEVSIPALLPEATRRVISAESRAVFQQRLAKVDRKLHKHYLSMYANPVVTRYRVIAE